MQNKERGKREGKTTGRDPAMDPGAGRQQEPGAGNTRMPGDREGLGAGLEGTVPVNKRGSEKSEEACYQYGGTCINKKT